MLPVIAFISFVGSFVATNAILDRTRPAPRPLSSYEDIGYEDADGTWHSLIPEGGSFDDEGYMCVDGVRIAEDR